MPFQSISLSCAAVVGRELELSDGEIRGRLLCCFQGREGQGFRVDRAVREEDGSEEGDPERRKKGLLWEHSAQLVLLTSVEALLK